MFYEYFVKVLVENYFFGYNFKNIIENAFLSDVSEDKSQ